MSKPAGKDAERAAPPTRLAYDTERTVYSLTMVVPMTFWHEACFGHRPVSIGKGNRQLVEANATISAEVAEMRAERSAKKIPSKIRQ